MERWGGIPRYVLQLQDAAHQAMLQQAVDCCSLDELVSCMIGRSHASESTQHLVHMTVEDGYLQGPGRLASDWVKTGLIEKYVQSREREVRDFLAASGDPDEATIATFRGSLWVQYAHAALRSGGIFECRELQQDGSSVSTQLEIEPESRHFGLWDPAEIGTSLQDGVYRYGWNKSSPSVDAVIQPDKLFVINVSSDFWMYARGLMAALKAMRAGHQGVKVYHVAHPDDFQNFTRQTSKRSRDSFEATQIPCIAKQFVLKLDP